MRYTKSRTTLLILCSCLSFFACSEPVQTETFLQQILRISGISATPQQMRGQEKGQAGQLWIVHTETKEQQQVSSSSDFRSPVFMPDDSSLLALKETELIEVSLPGGVAKPLFNIPGVIKIIGFDQSDNDRFLVLLEDNQLALVSLKTGIQEILNYPSSPETDAYLSHIINWDRAYGDTRVFVRTRPKRTIRGRHYLSNVYYQRNRDETDLSRCVSSSCSQPSLSHNGKRVVFIKSD